MNQRLFIRNVVLASVITFGLSMSLLPENARAEDSSSNVFGENARYVGTYEYGESLEHGRAIIREAMSRAMAQLPPALRNLARRMLADSDPLVHRIVIDLHNGLISVRFMGERNASYSTRPGVTEKVTNLRGKQVDLTQRFTEQGLEQVIVAPRARTRVLYMLRADGQQLVVNITMETGLLSSPISYQLIYVRR